MTPESMNNILAHYPDQELELWHRPGEGVFLCHGEQITWHRICSKADFDQNYSALIEQGWILGTTTE
jgi:hypothetical protein